MQTITEQVQLMAHVAAGDRPALETLVSDHYPTVFRLLRHLTRSQEDAEDLAQEVFLTAQRHSRTYRGQASVRTWLCQIATNAYRRQHRRDQIRRLLHLSKERGAATDESMVDAEWLLDGLAQLSGEHRTALILHEVHGFSVVEIAEITQSPAGTVKARLHYGRKRLRQVLVCTDEEHGK